MRAPSPESVLDGLDPEQLAVATAPVGPVCVLAGAGTGKTRAITHRIAHGVLTGVLDPRQVLAVTFTTRAAGELRGRLRELGVPAVAARTFHAAALRQVQYFWPRVLGGHPPRVLEGKLGLLGESVGRLHLRVDRAGLRDLAGEVEWAKSTLVPHGGYAASAAAAGRTPPAGLDLVAVERILAAYEEVKGARALMDFEDVLLYDVALIVDTPSVAREVRAQYRHLVVDEYQDVSPLQQQLLDLWGSPAGSLCVVGDPAQTIYSFAGATASYLVDFPRRHPDASVVRLVRDYRSTPQVVAFANAVLSVRSGVQRLVAVRPDGPEPTMTRYDDENAEARGVAAAIAGLVEGGTPARDVAVLFRTNSVSAAFEEALDDVGVPYVLRGAERFFDRPEVRQAHTRLRAAAWGPAAHALEARGSGAGLPEAVSAVLTDMGWTVQPPPRGGAVRERWESLAALVTLAGSLASRQPDADLAALVAELDQRAATAQAPPVDGVTLASLHAAKGLEWEAVFLVGLTDGMLPISYARTQEAIAEERRLLYVGVTRARSRLAVSWAQARTPGGAANRRPSRFLDGLLPESARPRVAGAPPGSARSGRPGGSGDGSRRQRAPATCRRCGRMLTSPAERKVGRCGQCPSTADEALVSRLREWRLERAREDGVPAYVVFTDATLTAIAETSPTSREGLATVPGVGPTKLDRYGPAVLDILAAGQGHAT